MSFDEEELLEEVSGFLHGYLKNGKVKINSFASKININIANLEQLLMIRFLLKQETKQFAKELPELLKQFKTTTTVHNEVNIGEVRGQIDWEQTIKERLARNYKDKTIFSTNENIRSYDTPDNHLLKEVLGLLYHLLYTNNYIKGFEKAKWFAEWQDFKGNIIYAYQKNIYLQRVENKRVSDRTIQKTLNHRNKLYREAAKLLFSYRKLLRGEYSQDDIKEILQETFIAPDNKNVLFELYWIVQMIKNNTEDSELHLIDGSQNMVASWEKEGNIYNLFHDSNGSEEINFNVKVDEIKESNNLYLKQKYESFQMADELKYNFFKRNPSNHFWSGRPDFLLEVYDKETDALVKLIIGEVKNTSDVEYTITGLKELLDYVHLVKNNKGDYLYRSNVPVEGVLCVGDVTFDEAVNFEKVKIVSRDKNIGAIKW